MIRQKKMIRRETSSTGTAPKIAAKAGLLLCAMAMLLFTRPATAAELAILRNGFSIRHDHRLAMGGMTRLYFRSDDTSFTDVPTEEITGYEQDISLPVADSQHAGAMQTGSGTSSPATSGLPLNEVVNTASAAYRLDPDLVNSVIHAESGFNSRAVSPKGARGLMQLMPSTASQLGVNDAFDPQANVAGGSRYLRELLERYNFDLIKALAAYNAGPERVEQYRGVPPFRETQAYVARIVHEYNQKKIAQERAEKAAKRKQLTAKSANKAATHTARAAAKPAGTAIAETSPH